MLQHLLRIRLRIQWKRWLMLGIALCVSVGRFFLLQASAVGEQDGTEVPGGLGAIDLTHKAVLD
jgi:hypothetical protein